MIFWTLRLDYTVLTKQYDITDVISPVDFTDNMNCSGITNFGLLPNGIKPMIGDEIEISSCGVVIKGNIFKIGSNAKPDRKITIYDQLRYLKTNDTYVFKGKTASNIASTLCSDFGLTLGQIEETGYSLGTMTFDNKNVLDMIADCVTKTLVDKKQLYYIKDIGGKVVFRNIQNSVVDLLVEPGSILIDFNHEESIDEDSFNQIKLVRDNKKTGQREIFMAKDSNNIQAWGRGKPLQYYEKLDDELNDAQAREKADSLLFLKNRIGQKLTDVNVIASKDDLKDVRAGNMIYIHIPEINVGKFLLCTAARHHFSNKFHNVKADYKLV